MAKAENPAQFAVTVEGEGTFTFAWRNMRRTMAIEVEFARLTEGVLTIHPFLNNMANAMADLKVLTIEAPEGWDVDELDGGDDDSYERLMKVWGALLNQERDFRNPAKGGEGDSPPLGEDNGVLVSPPLQPDPERPPVS